MIDHWSRKRATLSWRLIAILRRIGGRLSFNMDGKKENMSIVFIVSNDLLSTFIKTSMKTYIIDEVEKKRIADTFPALDS